MPQLDIPEVITVTVIQWTWALITEAEPPCFFLRSQHELRPISSCLL